MQWKPLSLNEKLISARVVNQIPTTGQAARQPGSQEEVQAAAVVEAGVLNDQATEVAVVRYNVLGHLFLVDLLTLVPGFGFAGLAH